MIELLAETATFFSSLHCEPGVKAHNMQVHSCPLTLQFLLVRFVHNKGLKCFQAMLIGS